MNEIYNFSETKPLLKHKVRDANERLEKRGSMSTYKEWKALYEHAKEMEPSKAMKLVQQAESDEERKFFAYIADMNLQRAQKKAIEGNLF